MFLDKNYVLANELVQKMDIHIANISMIKKQFEGTDDMKTIISMNNCTFIKSNSPKLPRNIREGIKSHTFTDVSNKLPCTYLRTEYPLSVRNWEKAGVINDKVKIAGKDFFEFTDDFVNKTRGKIVYILNEEETMDCFRKNQIEGYIQASKNKFITWY